MWNAELGMGNESAKRADGEVLSAAGDWLRRLRRCLSRCSDEEVLSSSSELAGNADWEDLSSEWEPKTQNLELKTQNLRVKKEGR
jgi:hypothetical protein